MVRGVPCMCMSTSPQPASATRGNIPGSAMPADMSLTASAPAARAARAVPALIVSTVSATSSSARIAATAGSRRRISSSAPTGSAPGRLDSAPRSRTSAPAAAMARARSRAASGSAAREASWKLSGVRLTMPMIRGRPAGSSTRLPRFHAGAEKGAGGPPFAGLCPCSLKPVPAPDRRRAAGRARAPEPTRRSRRPRRWNGRSRPPGPAARGLP